MSPAKARKAREIAIRGDPLGPGFDRERGKIGVRDEISLRTRDHTELPEDVPVAFARSEDNCVDVGPKRIGERAANR